MAGAGALAIISFSIVGCSSQSMLSGNAAEFVEQFQTAQRFEDSNEPQTNDVDYRLGTHDIKEIEEVPLDILEDYDMTGPQNSGIPTADVDSEVGNGESTVSTEDKKSIIYIYTAGNPDGDESGVAKLLLKGKDEPPVKQVLVPADDQALLRMAGVSSVADLKYTADEFQQLLVSFSTAVNRAYENGLDRSKRSDDEEHWCANVNKVKLDKRWDLMPDSNSDKYLIKYKLAGKEHTARCSGYYSKTQFGYVTLDMLYKYYVEHEFNSELFNSISNADVSQEESKRQKYFEAAGDRIPELNVALFQNFPVRNNNKMMLGQYYAGAYTSYALGCLYKKDALWGTISAAKAKKLQDFGVLIGASCGMSVNVVQDKDESSMYHSYISAGVDAKNQGAKVLVFCSNVDKKSDTVVNVSSSNVAAFKEAFEDAELPVRVGNNVTSLKQIGIDIPVVEVQLGKCTKDQKSDIAGVLAKVIDKIYVSGGIS